MVRFKNGGNTCKGINTTGDRLFDNSLLTHHASQWNYSSFIILSGNESRWGIGVGVIWKKSVFRCQLETLHVWIRIIIQLLLFFHKKKRNVNLPYVKKKKKPNKQKPTSLITLFWFTGVFTVNFKKNQIYMIAFPQMFKEQFKKNYKFL